MGRPSRVKRRTLGIAACLVLIGLLARAWQPLLAGSAVLGIYGWVLWRRWFGPGSYVFWSWRRSRRNHGMASRWQIFRKASRFAVRRQMRTLRPSCQNLSFWQRMRVPTTEFAYKLCRVGWLTVWATCEDVKLALGGPRMGKSGELAGRIIDAPGAVVATSTRVDLVTETAQLRAAKGPVFIFNPSGIGALASTVSFDPLSGCENPKAAVDRAGDLIAGGNPVGGQSADGEREHWAGQARDVLAVLMHAAALGGHSMRDVHAWVSDPDTHGDEIQRALQKSPEQGFQAELVHFVGTNDRTRSSITQSIRPALMWLHDPTAAHAAGQVVTAPIIDATGVTIPADDRPPALDVEALLAMSGTVYLLGAEDAQVAPLVAALTGHIARTARAVAGRQPYGRLDPPATFALDEAAIICPIPLPSWTSDMGGRGIPIHIAAQSRPQLRQRWGADGGAAITNNAAAVVIFGGAKDAADLQDYSTLAGEREERIVTRDHTGKVISATTQRVPVFTPAQIAQLPKGRVLLILRGLPPVIGKVKMSWQRADVKAVKRANRRAARAEKRQAVWSHRRDVAHQAWAAFKAAVVEVTEDIARAAGEWSERRHQAAWRRQEQQAGQVENGPADHERIDPQPAGPDMPADDARYDEASGGESDED
jgi:type IV secretion system protein VirD4